MPTLVLKNKPKTKVKNRSTAKPKTTTDAVLILQKLFGGPRADAYMVKERERVIIGSRIYDLRTEAGMTHAALAKKVGTTASVISRLEDADYESHSFPLLRKIAAVFGTRVEINFVPIEKKQPRKQQRKKAKKTK